MSKSTTVTTTARLHLGFLDLEAGLGRRFGSLGLSLDAPATRLTLRAARATLVEGAESERAGHHLAVLARHLGVDGGHVLTIDEVIPPHAGLGSGTQLALAVGAALRRLHDFAPD